MTAPILASYDQTERGLKVVATAHALATRLQCPLLVVVILEEEELAHRTEGRPAQSAYVDVIFEDVSREVAQQLEHHFGMEPGEVEVLVRQGEPGLAILDAAQARSPEMLVIGVRNRSRVGKLVFGSVPQSVLLGTTRPVVAVPLGQHDSSTSPSAPSPSQ